MFLLLGFWVEDSCGGDGDLGGVVWELVRGFVGEV